MLQNVVECSGTTHVRVAVCVAVSVAECIAECCKVLRYHISVQIVHRALLYGLSFVGLFCRSLLNGRGVVGASAKVRQMVVKRDV